MTRVHLARARLTAVNDVKTQLPYNHLSELQPNLSPFDSET